jgi:hypothetical protein
LNIINCDKCGKRANALFNNPEIGESESRRPCEVKVIEGYDETNCNDILHISKDKSYDLCRSCFKELRKKLRSILQKG